MVIRNHSPKTRLASAADQIGTPSRTFADRALAIFWRLNFAVVLAAFAWVFVDPLAPRTLGGVEQQLLPSVDAPANGALELRVDRSLAVVATSAFAALSAVALVASLFLGPARHRSVHSWLKLTALVALWLGLFVSWQEFAWAGQRWRLGRQLAPFTALADELRSHWPGDDARLAGLGQFSAYPIGRPRTLLVNAGVPNAGHTPIAVVDRSDAGVLRFRLAGDETGAWLEWHPEGDQPASFTDGLEEAHALDRASNVGEGWYLVRYR